MKFNVITIFPKIISDYCDETILARAQKNNLIKINPVDLRDFTTDNHKTVDDTPYGGGAGMVMKVEPIYKALQSLGALRSKGILSKLFGLVKKVTSNQVLVTSNKKRTILLSPRGKQFDQRLAEQLSKYEEITFVCGRYEGVDQRVTDHLIDQEISVGPYVLAGGELGALIIIEAVSRLLPGVLGNEESLKEETFGSKLSLREAPEGDEGIPMQKEYSQYTKPADFNGWKVPGVLLSGNHAEIKKWRQNLP